MSLFPSMLKFCLQELILYPVAMHSSAMAQKPATPKKPPKSLHESQIAFVLRPVYVT